MTRRVLATLVWVAVAAGVAAQPVPPDLPGRAAAGPSPREFVFYDGYLRVATSSPDAVAEVNGRLLEPNEWHAVSVSRADIHVRLVRRDRPFDGPSAGEVVPSFGGGRDSVEVRLELPVRTRVETLPLRARLALVHADGTERSLGLAPLDVDVLPGGSDVVVARLDGYAEARAALGGRARATLVLPPGPGVLLPEATVLPVDTRVRARARLAIDVSLVGFAAAAAAVSFEARLRADRLDDRYRDPTGPDFGDETLREQAVRLDRRALAGLAAMQVGLGVFAVRLVLR